MRAAGANGAQGATGPQGPAVSNLGGVIASDGAFVRGSGIVSSSQTGTGNYLVTFNQNVSACWPIAEVCGVGSESSGALASGARVTQASGNNNALVVSTWSYDGGPVGPANLAFHLIVDC